MRTHLGIVPGSRDAYKVSDITSIVPSNVVSSYVSHTFGDKLPARETVGKTSCVHAMIMMTVFPEEVNHYVTAT